MKHINEYTLEEFRAMENFGERCTFNSIIIVPMEELHDSGYRCMKFILLEYTDIVGVVGGWCDAVHPNGIGGYGKNIIANLKAQTIPHMRLSMDCLTNSGCIRLMMKSECVCDGFIGSDFCFYELDEEASDYL